MRSDPPGAAAPEPGNEWPRRRKVFSSALEQSERLFEAANATDFGIRPILIFYGLSQATRAIAAACTDRDLKDGSWKLSGDGLESRDAHLWSRDLPDVVITPTGVERSGCSSACCAPRTGRPRRPWPHWSLPTLT
jgi:hypothetical protein